MTTSRPVTSSEDIPLAYLIFAVVMATAIIGYLSMRLKTPNDPAKSVDTFQRAIRALAQETDGKRPKV